MDESKIRREIANAYIYGLKEKRHVPKCPQCARFREKMDREKIWRVLVKSMQESGDSIMAADALIAYLTE